MTCWGNRKAMWVRSLPLYAVAISFAQVLFPAIAHSQLLMQGEYQNSRVGHILTIRGASASVTGYFNGEQVQNRQVRMVVVSHTEIKLFQRGLACKGTAAEFNCIGEDNRGRPQYTTYTRISSGNVTANHSQPRGAGDLKQQAAAAERARKEAESKRAAESETRKQVELKAAAQAEARRAAEQKQAAEVARQAELKFATADEARKQVELKAAAQAEAQRVAEQKQTAEAARQAELKAAAEAEARKQAELKAAAQAEAQRVAEQKQAAEAARQAELKAAAEAEARKQAELKAAAQAEARRVAEQKQAAEAARQAELKAAAQAEARRVAEQKQAAEAARQAELKAAAEAEARKQAELKAAAQAEARRVAEQKQAAEAARQQANRIANAQQPTVSSAPAPIPEERRRVALVIGNTNYQHAARLENPTNDADLIALSLRSVGFQYVLIKKDVTREETLRALREFREVADTADWAVVHYAGHGIEFGGVNYLVPVEARLRSDRDIELETITISSVLSAIEGARRLRLIVLDACRDNPFAGQMRRTVASRSLGRGLAQMEPQAGTLIAYAAKHGEVADDGVGGKNSPFAASLAMRMQQSPALEVRRLFDFVRDDVMELTRNRQQPFTYGSLSARDDFFFATR